MKKEKGFTPSVSTGFTPSVSTGFTPTKMLGFTLIEVLIVIVVIAVILSFMGISVGGMQTEAKISKAKADLRTIQLALESYYKNHKEAFPPQNNYQRALILTNPQVLPGNMFDPFGGTVNTQYLYQLSSNGEYYVVYSLGMRRKGEASVSDTGTVAVSNQAIYVTNGKMGE